MQVCAQSVLRHTSSKLVCSADMRRAISWKEIPAHSQRDMAGGWGVEDGELGEALI